MGFGQRDRALWGIDLGGTKTEGCVAVFREQGVDTLARIRLATEAQRGYEAVVGRIGELVERLESETGLRRPATIGVGSPGAQRPDGTMKNCNTVCLNGRTLRGDLERVLGTGVVLANDADCFTLAEARLGSARGRAVVFGVIMGTGVGGGIAVGGRLVSGPNGLSGEWGHTTLNPGGASCYCGRAGCVETCVSGPAVEEAHERRTGVRLALAEIARRVGASADCDHTIRGLCEDFGRALSMVVNVLDPDAIVLGGGAGQVPQLLTWGREALRRHVFGPDFVTPLLTPALGASAGVFGAALLTAPAQPASD
jgi:predicted NBD/HSP70 family sugar kinase